MPIKREVDHNFFSEWNSDMSYVLGFFAADGSMIRNNRGAHFIEFHITDRSLLEDIRKLLASNHKITTRVRNSRWKTGYRLQIGSKKIFQDLIKIGFSQRKSNTLKFPEIPTEYVADYVRGYFDGDGCIYFKKHFVHTRKKQRWVFQVHFTSGSRSYLSDLKKVLHTCGLSGGFIQNKERGFELVFSHRDGLALYKLMYNNTGANRIFLARKKKKYDLAMATLYKVQL